MDGLLCIFQRLRKHLALDVRGGPIGKSNVLRWTVVRKLQRAVVTGNRFSKRTSPPVQDTLEKGKGVKHRHDWSVGVGGVQASALRRASMFIACQTDVVGVETADLVTSHPPESGNDNTKAK